MTTHAILRTVLALALVCGAYVVMRNSRSQRHDAFAVTISTSLLLLAISIATGAA